MNTLQLRLRFFTITFAATMFVGIMGFMIIENLSLVDALYFSIVTVATVGYGDIYPLTPAGRVFAIIIIVMGVGTFLGVIAQATEIMLNRREKGAKLRKINMLIGVFFSEVGLKLLIDFLDCDPHINTLRERLVITEKWSPRKFQAMFSELARYEFSYNIDKANLEELYRYLSGKRECLIRLLENPVLLEQEAFTELLLAVFHLTEELSYRQDFKNMPESDKKHLAGDAKRVYHMLVEQWLHYLQYLQGQYPYLFSLAMRTNPFDGNASPVVKPER